MSWSYNPSIAADADRVRLYLGDTDIANQLLQDEEIGVLLDVNGSVVGAAVAGCTALAARFARDVQKSVGSMSLAAQQRFEHYRDLRLELLALQQRTLGLGGKPYAGGISVADKERNEHDADRTAPLFTRQTGSVGSATGTRWGRS